MDEAVKAKIENLFNSWQLGEEGYWNLWLSETDDWILQHLAGAHLDATGHARTPPRAIQ